MNDALFLREKDRLAIVRLLAEHLPQVTAWAYGSRVNGAAHEGSDLDIVLRSPDLSPIPLEELRAFVRAVRDSTIPILVEARDWARLPESFQGEILKNYVVLREIVSEWKECSLGDILTFQRGYDLPRQSMQKGTFPVAGSNGIIGYHNEFTTEACGITIGRSGHIGIPHFYKEKFWAHNTVLYVKEFYGNEPKFIFYFLKTFDFDCLNTGSAIPSLNRNHVHTIDVRVPPLPEQKAIASVLSSLDDKIDLLHRQNKTLEAMAEALFRQWFIEEAGEDWEDGKIEDLFILQRGFDLPEHSRNEGTVPIYAASGLNGFHDEYKVQSAGVTTGRSGLLGRVFFIQYDFWPLNTSLFIKEFKKSTPLFSYFFLKNIDLESFDSGSAVPTLNRNHLHDYEIAIPPKKIIQNFETLMMVNFKKIKINCEQIRTLEKLRDTLLPKLMSGEVRVAY